MAARLSGWRFGVFIGTLVSAIGTTMYFTAIRPMLNPDAYKQIREVTEPQLRPRLD